MHDMGQASNRNHVHMHVSKDFWNSCLLKLGEVGYRTLACVERERERELYLEEMGNLRPKHAVEVPTLRL